MAIKLQKGAHMLHDQRFGRLVAIEPVGKDSGGRVLWRCKCDCDKETIVTGYDLVHKRRRSCGCAQGKVAPSLCLDCLNLCPWVLGRPSDEVADHYRAQGLVIEKKLFAVYKKPVYRVTSCPWHRR